MIDHVGALIGLNHGQMFFTQTSHCLCVCVIYCEDGLQLVLVDLSVAVLVEQFEVPLQFLVDLSFQQQADGCDVLHEVDVTVLLTETQR